LPSFESLVAGAWIEGSKDKLNKDERGSQDKKVHGYQRNLAFTADRTRLSVWNGDGYSFIQSADGVGLTQTPSVSALAKSLWPNDTHLNSTKPEACSFSPDGKTFAAIIMNDWVGTKKYALCLWDVQNPGDPTKYVMPANQYHESLSIMWWGNKYIATQGGQREGMIVEVRTGLAKRQIMVPDHSHASFGRDGRLWYAISAENKDPATIIMVDGLDPDQLSESDDYDQIRELGDEFYLRRLWLEPSGVLRKPSRYNPPITKRLIRRP
jgi:WD40 repeat protein